MLPPGFASAAAARLEKSSGGCGWTTMSARASWPSSRRGSQRDASKPPPVSVMSRRLLWSLLLGIAVSLAVLIATNDQDAITNLLRHDVSAVVLKAALAIFVAGLLLVVFRERLTKAFEALLFWVVIGLLLAVGYSYRLELHEAGDRVLAELI